MPSSKFSRLVPAAIALALTGVAATASTAAPSSRAAKSLLRSAIALDVRNETIALLFKGRIAAGKTTWYVVTDSSSRADASHRGVNFAPRLKNALGTKAVQKARRVGGVLRFAGTVDFSPERKVVPGAEGFPPATAEPGAVGDTRYSPLVTIGGGVVIDAPQVKNGTGQSDSVVSIDTKAPA